MQARTGREKNVARPAQFCSIRSLLMTVAPHIAVAALLALETSARADPLAEMAAFSAFKGMTVEKLAAGSVKAARGPAMSFPRGLAVESCYIVRKPLAKTVEQHQQWSPAKHPELKVYP